MACTRGKASPNSFVKSKLFAGSGGYCQNPNCNEILFKSFDSSDIHIAEIAHIISVNEGARKNEELTPEEKGSYENLILLCPNCHTTIDKAENDFPEDLILKWKKEHQSKLNSLFGIRRFTSRTMARNHIEQLLLENKTIFETYGPNTDERFNPESQMPALWLKKIREFIIPNNRKILNIILANYNLLKEEEKVVVEYFKQHINDFEGKHIFGNEENGLQFPFKMNEIYA
jgi:hypothetical protein